MEGNVRQAQNGKRGGLLGRIAFHDEMINSGQSGCGAAPQHPGRSRARSRTSAPGEHRRNSPSSAPISTTRSRRAISRQRHRSSATPLSRRKCCKRASGAPVARAGRPQRTTQPIAVEKPTLSRAEPWSAMALELLPVQLGRLAMPPDQDDHLTGVMDPVCELPIPCSSSSSRAIHSRARTRLPWNVLCHSFSTDHMPRFTAHRLAGLRGRAPRP